MNTIKTIKMIVAAALLAVSFNASAAFINGEITMSGDFLPTGGTDLSNATGIDFQGDDFEVDDATGDFALAGIVTGDVGAYFDFDFAPLASGTTVWAIGDFSFVLNTIAVLLQTENFIVLEGTGVMSAINFDDTNGTWNLSGNRAGSLFNYSSGTVVSEPATLALVGLGFIGLAVARRRAQR